MHTGVAVHEAGSVGGQTLTVVSVGVSQNDPNLITSITFSGAALNDPNAVKQYDKFEFQDNVPGQPNIRFRTFVGHEISSLPVQCAVNADAGSLATGQVTVQLTEASYLKSAAGNNQNISAPIAPGMQAKFLPSHRCGLIMAGDPLFLGMPRLPEEVPFPTSVVTDPDSGASLRQYYGSLFGQNQRGMVHDAIWGKKLVPEYAMMYALPV